VKLRVDSATFGQLVHPPVAHEQRVVEHAAQPGQRRAHRRLPNADRLGRAGDGHTEIVLWPRPGAALT
jgi:hypothetical protein